MDQAHYNRTAFKHIICLTLLILYTHTTKAQNRNSSEYYKHYYTGCWQTDSMDDGYLITSANQTFQWIKQANKAVGNIDTLRGTWDIRSVYSIPFKGTVIRLKFLNGGRKKI